MSRLRPQMEIRCGTPECGKIFSAPSMNFNKFQQLFRQYGWRVRGSVAGPLYYCGTHAD